MLKKMMGIGVLAMTLGICGSAFANEVATQGTSNVYFDMTVPGLGNAQTPNQTKTNSGMNGEVQISSTGNNYPVEARMTESGSGSGPWTSNLYGGDVAALEADSDMLSGEKVYMELQTTTGPIDVRVTGAWKSN